MLISCTVYTLQIHITTRMRPASEKETVIVLVLNMPFHYYITYYYIASINSVCASVLSKAELKTNR